jgi:hypothetical protein
MRRFHVRAPALAAALLVPAALLFGGMPRAQTGADDTTVGVLGYTAPPDLTICFCGPYRIEPDRGFAAYYLTSASIDLSAYVGKKIQVSGTSFVKACTGTLLVECPFLMVMEVDSTPMPSQSSTWGMIKALYR